VRARLAHARDWLDKGRFDRALAEASAARQLDPEAADVQALLTEIQRRQSAADAERAAARSARAASVRALFSNAYLWVGIGAIVVLAGGGWLLTRQGGPATAPPASPSPATTGQTPAVSPQVQTPVQTPTPGETQVQQPSQPEPGQAPPVQGAEEPGLPPLAQREGESAEQWTERRRAALARFNEGQALLGRGRFPQALTVFEALARAEPDYPNLQERIAATRRAIDAAMPTPQRLFAEGQRLEGNNDMIGAMDRYRAAAAADPDLPGLTDRMNELQALMVLRAERLMSQAEAEAPKDVAAAVRSLEQALRYLPSDHPRAAVARRELERLRGGAQ
jgi:tetratricopeptide (TPR) repeat protein